MEFLAIWGKNSNTKVFYKHIPIYRVENTISDGMTFGDIALSYSNRRTATCVTSKKCVFLTLQKSVFTSILKNIIHLTSELIIKVKEHFPGLYNNNLANILCKFKKKIFPFGCPIIKFNTIPKYCYIVDIGEVKVLTKVKHSSRHDKFAPYYSKKGFSF